MKAVVVEIKEGYAALLKENGSFVKMRNRNFKIGDVVNMKENTARRKGRFGAMVAAAALFAMLIGAGTWAYTTPYYHVSLDVNPSVLMEVNMFERVIGMEAVNEEAAAVLEGLDLKNKGIEDAISEAVARITEAGYFDEEDGNILITSVGRNNDKAERLAERLRKTAEAGFGENGAKPEVAAIALGYEMVQEAKALGITPGKLNIITNLLGEEVGDNANESVSDLMARYTATKGAEGRERAEQAGEQKGNGPPDIPAPENKPPNADAGRDNATNKRPEAPGLGENVGDDEGEE